MSGTYGFHRNTPPFHQAEEFECFDGAEPEPSEKTDSEKTNEN